MSHERIIRAAIAVCNKSGSVAQLRKALRSAGLWPPTKARTSLIELREQEKPSSDNQRKL
jgi:hypothetical protein